MDIFKVLSGNRIVVLSIEDERAIYTWTPSSHMLTLWRPTKRSGESLFGHEVYDLNDWVEFASIVQTDGIPIHTYGDAREAAAEWHNWHSRF
jgi:hypothetical protein